jgi:ABC-type phosphate/phosphonate transport system substrate-binding protein
VADAAGAVSFPMYDLPELSNAHDALWQVLCDELADHGLDAGGGRARSGDVASLWTDPRLLLSQACGWPLVTELGDVVTVVGTFLYDAPSVDRCGRYRSVLVAPIDAPARWRVDLATTRAAVNGFTSLSGWISLRLALLGDLRPWPGPVVLTGSHVDSLRTLRAGDADVAAIDAVTFSLLRRHRPCELDGVAVVGFGRSIPCLPLITAAHRDATVVAGVQTALRTTLAHPRARPACRTLGVRGFVPVGEQHYEPLRRLADPVAVR